MDSPAPQLWNFIYELLDVLPPDMVRVRWIPSHLDDPRKAAAKIKYIASGTTSDMHISGNVQADGMAAQGTNRHLMPPSVKQYAHDRAA